MIFLGPPDSDPLLRLFRHRTVRQAVIDEIVAANGVTSIFELEGQARADAIDRIDHETDPLYEHEGEQAVIYIEGTRITLGRVGSPESWVLYWKEVQRHRDRTKKARTATSPSRAAPKPASGMMSPPGKADSRKVRW